MSDINKPTPKLGASGELSRTAPVQGGMSGAIRSDKDRTKAPRERFHFGLPQSKLQVWNQDPAYHYHWVNDTPGRIEMALASGYDFVNRDDVTLLPGVTPRNSDAGSKISAIVGSQESNEPLRAYLMRTPLALYEENQSLLQGQVNATEDAIRKGKTTGQEGSSFYVPKGAPIRMTNKDGD